VNTVKIPVPHAYLVETIDEDGTFKKVKSGFYCSDSDKSQCEINAQVSVKPASVQTLRLTKDLSISSEVLSDNFIQSDTMKVSLDISDGQASLSIENKKNNSKNDLKFDIRYWSGHSSGGQNEGAYIFINEAEKDSRLFGNFTDFKVVPHSGSRN
jgi:hypothetical protein